jgi:hypothetical protein
MNFVFIKIRVPLPRLGDAEALNKTYKQLFPHPFTVVVMLRGCIIFKPGVPFGLRQDYLALILLALIVSADGPAGEIEKLALSLAHGCLLLLLGNLLGSRRGLVFAVASAFAVALVLLGLDLGLDLGFDGAIGGHSLQEGVTLHSHHVSARSLHEVLVELRDGLEVADGENLEILSSPLLRSEGAVSIRARCLDDVRAAALLPLKLHTSRAGWRIIGSLRASATSAGAEGTKSLSLVGAVLRVSLALGELSQLRHVETVDVVVIDGVIDPLLCDLVLNSAGKKIIDGEDSLGLFDSTPCREGGDDSADVVSGELVGGHCVGGGCCADFVLVLL